MSVGLSADPSRIRSTIHEACVIETDRLPGHVEKKTIIFIHYRCSFFAGEYSGSDGPYYLTSKYIGVREIEPQLWKSEAPKNDFIVLIPYSYIGRI